MLRIPLLSPRNVIEFEKLEKKCESDIDSRERLEFVKSSTLQLINS